MDIMQIGALGIVATILSLTIKKYSPSVAIMLSVVVGVIIFMGIIPKLVAVIDVINNLMDISGMNKNYIEVILKILGISYVAQFCAQICMDAGEGSIANKIELGGKVLIMISGVPVLLGLVEMVLKLLP